MKSPSGEMPQYLMIKAQLQARIQNGALKSGDKLPSERELCALFNTTRITVRESPAQLEASGVIYRADRRGWFVTPERLWLDPTQNTNFHKLCLEQGREPKTVLLDGRGCRAAGCNGASGAAALRSGLFADPAALCRRAAGMLLRKPLSARAGA
ncbi:hypothetical protein KPZU09_53030 [Klebsiella pneumoniae]|uniref:HTH gntR-type domain-containing protein n=1 Tax=Klebsiella pneumoniae TaxID=573 RepID=A0A919HXF0_KLEPN|nr:hypothetical protein KPZU09_53030 [Klebsiella pneumoniae]